MNINQILNGIYPLPDTSLKALAAFFTEISQPKGHILIHADKTEQAFYFIRKGIVRAYAGHDGNEVTFWFGREGEAAISMRSYVENKPGYEDIELLEDCDLYEIRAADLQALYSSDIHIANWGRKFAEHELMKTEKRLISRQFRTATERYKELLKDNPGLIQRVQLGHIASYLGITQVSLSRIRGEIR
ncbi:Crp/Fnr family transcriptional regulator [uncultured Flavobacterium sp.]|uniref:Crp/Fnr family transcriptional regulator n=1 Tax=uncultured Flavobacterium sp. TaxID=165435 RepID=UPI0025EB60A6|nr:Crp/Fnr family transcriptional regulator [uncultured Flavobacterium sp.]